MVTMLNRATRMRPEVIRRSAAQMVGGRYGHMAANATWVPTRWWFNPMTIAGLLIAAFMSVAVMLRNHCLETGFGSPGQFRYACYSDIPANALTAQFDSWLPPLWDNTATGFLTSIGSTQLLWLCSRLAPRGDNELVYAFWVQVLLATVALVAMAYAVLRTRADDPWRLALIAASPLILVEALIGFETVAAAFAAFCVLAATKGRATTAGVLAGIAALIVPAYLLLILAVVITMWRRFDRGTAMYSLVGGLLVVVVIHASQFISNRDLFNRAIEGIFPANAGYGGLWFLPSLADITVAPDAVRWGSLGLLAAWLLVITVWAVKRPQPLTLASLALLYLIGYVLVSPSVPVQAGMWLLPLAVMSMRRIDILGVWMLFEVFFAIMTWQFIYEMSEANKGAPQWVYALGVYGRAIILAFMAFMTWYEADERPQSSSDLSPAEPARVRESASEPVH